MASANTKDSKNPFWKKNPNPIPGKLSLKKPETVKSKSKAISSFKDFEKSVNDVWDVSDAGKVKISKIISNQAALNVIKYHKASFEEALMNRKYMSEDGVENLQYIPEIKLQRKKVEHACRREVLVHNKGEKFEELLNNKSLDMEALSSLCWNGIPKKWRSLAWKILSGYLPVGAEYRKSIMDSKRRNYWNLVEQYYKCGIDDSYQDTYRQIHIDIPRTNPMIALFQQRTVQVMYERILFTWAIRHPASGYVQGMNDLVTPFFIVFLKDFITNNEKTETFDVNKIKEVHRNEIEADTFWCLSKLLDSIQDNYIFAQLGIQKKITELKDLTQRIDNKLHSHLIQNGVDYLQFSFRWMNNLLTRELPLKCTIRLWDTYLAESDQFNTFHLYVCAAFLIYFRELILKERDFQGIMLLLQNLPTQKWTDDNIDLLVAEAYRLKFMFADAPSHLQQGSSERHKTL